MSAINLKFLLLFLLLTTTGCASPSSRYKTVSDELFRELKESEAAILFPDTLHDIRNTINQGDIQLLKDDFNNADVFYQLAIGKIELLEKSYDSFIKRREEEARQELELIQRKAAEELKKKQDLERKQAEVVNRETTRQKHVEQEKQEVKRRVERTKAEKEIPLVTSHVVKRGETLPQIAALPEVYGESSLWPLLYRANRDQISNPAVLWPGQVLRIPRNIDKNDLSEARKYSSERKLR